MKISDEALFNEKINAAAQGLAARREVMRTVAQHGRRELQKEMEDDLVTRAAAIDRLEGLVAERPDVAPRIDRLLATYVRGTFPHDGLEETENLHTRRVPRIDLQKAIDVIGRVHSIAILKDQSQWRLDLKGCDLDGVSLRGGCFYAADFSNCRMEAAMLLGADFCGGLFRDSLLNFAEFFDSDLTGAKLDGAVIRQATNLAVMSVAKSIRGASFDEADISGILRLGNSAITSETFGTADTIVSSQMSRAMLPHDVWQNARIASEVAAEGEEISVEEQA